MITDSTKAVAPIVAVALVAGAVYGVAAPDRAGRTIFLMLVVAGATLVAACLRFRLNDVAPPAADDALAPEPRAVAVEPTPGGGLWPMLVGLSVALVAAGFVVGEQAAAAGVVVGACAAVGWVAHLTGAARRRTFNLLPIGLPLTAAFAIGAAIFFVSRILLAVPEEASTLIAIVLAVVIMAGAALVAARPRISRSALMGTLALAGLALVAAGIVAGAVGPREVHRIGGPGPISITARNTQFDKRTIELQAGAPSVIDFTNRDIAAHNVAIYEDASAVDLLYAFEPIPGPVEQQYNFTAPDRVGDFYFRCDVHPAMEGRAVIDAPEQTEHE